MLNNRQSGRRRGRGGQRPQGNGRGQDQGNRIDNRARGNAPQLLEKYKSLARDAQMAGDRVMTEYYLQFADHYFRVVAENRARFEEQRRQRDDWRDEEEDGVEGEDRLADEGDAEDGEEREDRGARQERDDDGRNNRNRNRDRNFRNRDERDGNRRPREDRFARNGTAEESDASDTIDVNVLPPAFGSDGPLTPIADLPVMDIAPEPADDEEAPRPRRGRRPRREELSNEAA